MGHPRRNTFVAFFGAIGLMAVFIIITLVGVDRSGNAQDASNDAETAAVQGRQNGENLCEFAVATSDAFKALAEGNLTPSQAVAVHHMRKVARSCRAAPP